MPDPGVPTNRNFVLRVGHERTILVHHEQHECHWPHLRPAEVPSWLYLSSVGTDSHVYEDQIVDWLEAEPQVSLAFERYGIDLAPADIAAQAHAAFKAYQTEMAPIAGAASSGVTACR